MLSAIERFHCICSVSNKTVRNRKLNCHVQSFFAKPRLRLPACDMYNISSLKGEDTS